MSNSASTCSTRASSAAPSMPCRCAKKRSVSRGVSRLYKPIAAERKPMLRRTLSGSVTMSCPATRPRPAVGVRIVERQRSVVVSPAPWGPSSPYTSPALQESVASDTAATMPPSGSSYSFARCSTSIKSRRSIPQTGGIVQGLPVRVQRARDGDGCPALPRLCSPPVIDKRRRNMIRRSVAIPFIACAILSLALSLRAADSSNPFVGDWALTLPDGHAGWLGVTDENGKLAASLLWSVGSVLPVDQVKRDGDALVLTRGRGRDALTFTARADGDTLR